MPTLLVVDDEPNVRYSLCKGLQTDSLEVITAETAGQGIDLVRDVQPDAVILDIRLSDMSGLDAFDRMRQIDPHLPIIIITAFGTMETAIEATKKGAFEYMLKPADLHQLRDIIGRAIRTGRMGRVPAVFDSEDIEDDAAVDVIVGRSPAMQEVFKAIGRVAPQDVNILLLGESGTGKELVTRAIHQHSSRADKPLLAINCAAIPEALLESELFGHERGAFTGADRRRIGKFEQADGGTIFLDEIGDMTPATQAKVLRLLQDGCCQRVGGNETIQTNVRVIAATNHDLEKRIAEGLFREDLFYRLNVFTLRLPPLRERMDDMPLLVEHFCKRFSRDLSRSVRSVSPEAMQLLENYSWPGNVRQLQGALQYALVRSTGEVLTPECLPESILAPDKEEAAATADGVKKPDAAGAEKEPDQLDVARLVRDLLQQGAENIYYRVQREVDRVVIDEVLRHAQGNQVTASRLLGVSRTTLRSKMLKSEETTDD